jgi:hypothetical protein
MAAIEGGRSLEQPLWLVRQRKAWLSDLQSTGREHKETQSRIEQEGRVGRKKIVTRTSSRREM